MLQALVRLERLQKQVDELQAHNSFAQRRSPQHPPFSYRSAAAAAAFPYNPMQPPTPLSSQLQSPLPIPPPQGWYFEGAPRGSALESPRTTSDGGSSTCSDQSNMGSPRVRPYYHSHGSPYPTSNRATAPLTEANGKLTSANRSHTRVHKSKPSARGLHRIMKQSRRGREAWRTKATLDDSDVSALLVPPLRIANLNDDTVPEDPDPLDDTVPMDPFTRGLWLQHRRHVAEGKSNVLYTTRSLVPDSYYIHVVKEVYQKGHLLRCGLNVSNPSMYYSIVNKLERNVRYMLFDIPASASFMLGSSPLLCMVRHESMGKVTPSFAECVRVIPISQARAVMERLHHIRGHRTQDIEQQVHHLCIGMPRKYVVRRFIEHCATCKAQQRLDHKRKQVKPIRSQSIRERYVVDLIEMPPEQVEHDGTYKYILVQVDHYSRLRWTAPLKTKHASVVNKLLVDWWATDGKPDILQSDNGLEFAAEEIKELAAKWGVRKRHSRPYKPSTNGSVERANRDVEERLAVWTREHPEQGWVAGLQRTTSMHNDSWSRVHRCSPNALFRSKPPPSSRLHEPAPDSVRPLNDWSDPSTDAEVELIPEAAPPQSPLQSRPQSPSASDSSEDREVGQVHLDAQVTDGEVLNAPVRREIEQAADVEMDHLGDGASPCPVQAVAAEAPAEPVVSSISIPASSSQVFSQSSSSGDSVVSMQNPLLEDGTNVPDEPHPDYGNLDILAPGRTGGMRYPQWKRISSDIYHKMRRVGVLGLGDCGVIAPYCAYHSYYREGLLNMTEEDVDEVRKTSAAWLTANQDRYEKDSGTGFAVIPYEEMLRIVSKKFGWVHDDYLWVFAMQYQVNVYLVNINATKRDGNDLTTFSVQLITPEKRFYNENPIDSDVPNTIAVQLHTVRRSRDVGHFEYLIDEHGNSLWKTSHPVVKNILQPAAFECDRVNYLNTYTASWEKSVNKRIARRLHVFAIGELANLMISDYMRDRSSYVASIDGNVRNMVVKVIELPVSEQLPRRYRILAHAGVVTTWVQQGELRTIGQDIDNDLLKREVTSEMLKSPVSLMQAWNFWLERRRPAQSQGALPPLPAPNFINSPPASRTRSRGANAAASGTGAVHICAACKQPFRLALNEVVRRCVGRCQQTIHSTAAQCSRGGQWIALPYVGVCCSIACASVFKQQSY